MRLWIPDIGDKIKLTADWTFTLINEGRNGAIWKALDLDRHPDAIAAAALRDAKFAAAQSHDKAHRTARTTMSWGGHRLDFDTPENESISEALWEEYHSLRDLKVDVTLPKDTELTVDRVYIRKGASEFSSLTFFIGHSPMKELLPVKKGGRWPSGPRRFFARLSDVNKIEFDPIV
jgi:hypothetical protein